MTDGERLILAQLQELLSSSDAALLTLKEILEELRNQSAQALFNRR
jgi:hypothetical protein